MTEEISIHPGGQLCRRKKCEQLTVHNKGGCAVRKKQAHAHQPVLHFQTGRGKAPRIQTQDIRNGGQGSTNDGHDGQNILPVSILFVSHPARPAIRVSDAGSSDQAGQAIPYKFPISGRGEEGNSRSFVVLCRKDPNKWIILRKGCRRHQNLKGKGWILLTQTQPSRSYDNNWEGGRSFVQHYLSRRKVLLAFISTARRILTF